MQAVKKTMTTAQVVFLMGAIVACVGDDPSSGSSGGDDGGSSSSGSTSSSGGGTSSSGGGTSSSGGSSGEVDAGVDSGPLSPDAAPPAGCPLGCLPPPPADWTGPSAVWDDVSANKPVACPATYTLKETETHREMTAANATCTCGSGTNLGAKCTSTVRVYTGTSNGCTTKAGFNELTVTSNGCSTAVGSSATDVFVLSPTFTQGTSCTYAAPSVTKPAPAFGKETVSCGLPQTAASCENRADCVATPIPEAPFTRLCIHKDGDELCPSADYGVRFVTYKSIDDQRACNSDCVGTPFGGSCNTSWGFSASGSKDCLAASVDPPPSDYAAGSSCIDAPSSTSVINGRALVPKDLSCLLKTPATPKGAATSIDPVTFCCNK